MDADVMIAGGCIGGATLALALGRRGRTVAVLKRERGGARIVRPEIFWEPTLAAFDRLGVGRRLRDQAALPGEGLQVRRLDEPLFEIGPETIDAAGTRPWSTDASATRSILLEEAVATGRVTVHRGAEVLEQTRAGLRARIEGAERELSAPLVVGDDGVRSVVRRSAGIALETRPFPAEFVTVPLADPPPGELRRFRAWVDPANFGRGLFAGGIIPLPGGRAVCLFPVRAGTWEERYSPDAGAFWWDLALFHPWAGWLRDRLRFPGDFTRIHRPYGHAARYWAEGTAILGDAAHPMSPAGGQGANAAIGDALAPAEAAVDPTPERLADYERRRRPANERSLCFTRSATLLFGLVRWIPGAASWLAWMILRYFGRPELKAKLLERVSTSFEG